ncbi:MAG: regulatory iron-sulfur-containing complex subunit RicT [candidate division Zixibacteria bacterium]|nr:regulatory iron-sulfur-containing complex subunit RicT [candidate division Zixibacteria bacterium]MDH3935962.1 regulatory iron-sulfur-containing complex subunit RicT [candidate division Zixibacteria bacterium]MDH4035531.1 regulatory iron-sulfur-containing complex subunit RicT [candidate division Zixibacteria bacterium]
MAELYLVEFKGSRKEYFFNSYYHSLKIDDLVIVQAERGEDIGVLLNKVETQSDLGDRGRPRSILRRASGEDVEALQDLRSRERDFQGEVIKTVATYKLEMKVVDVECQFDGNKMTIYFTADHRVDFRELVKELAAKFRTRIELRQIGVRDEARRLGGYGICGLRQCCNTFIQDFAPISTQHAREQDLPLNPAKISGNCGRLLCCLRYEAGQYGECKRRFPAAGSHVTTKAGESGTIERIDIFKEEAIIRDSEGHRFSSPADGLMTPKGRAETIHGSTADGSTDARKRRQRPTNRPSDKNGRPPETDTESERS